MTGPGTNSYILGAQTLCLIDPGPDDPAHLRALLAQIGRRRVSHIIVTHSHLDHSGGTRALAQATGAPVLAFGDSLAGQSAVMQRLAQRSVTGGGEGVDMAFRPDRIVTDGQTLEGPDWQLRVIHTPGHLGNHICLRWGDAIFCGDHVMGWATSLVSPPDGDLTDFMESCARLQGEAARVLYPGHGDPVTDPAARIGWLMDHRRGREAQILHHLALRPHSLTSLTAAVYTDTPAHLHPAAARNVLAHLVDLAGRNMVAADPDLQIDATFRCM